MLHKIITALFIFFLTSCGGGGTDPIARASLAIDDFLGTWNTTDSNCYFAYNDDGSVYWWTKEAPLTLTNRTYTEQYYIYPDDSCGGDIGIMTFTYTTEWSAPTSTNTAPGAIRLKISSPVKTTQGITPLNLSYDSNLVGKILLLIESNRLKLFVPTNTEPLDIDGFPLGVTPTTIYSR